MTLNEYNAFDNNVRLPAARYGNEEDQQRQAEADVFGNNDDEFTGHRSNDDDGGNGSDSKEEGGILEGNQNPP